GQMDQRVHPVKGGPVVAELELGDAGGRDLERPAPVGAETERLQDEDTTGDAVRDQADGLALMGGAKPLEPGEGPGAQVLERLRPGPAGGLGRLGPRGQRVGEARLHLVAGKSHPLPKVHLRERLLHVDDEAVRGGDGRRGLAGAGERARPDVGQGGGGEQPRGGLGLLAAGRRQRDVAPALEAALPVPVGLGVANQQDAHAAQRSPRAFWAARTPAPRSTGCPSSCSTCSSAASAVITSKSATYPMWPMRKTWPFISPCPPAMVMLCEVEYVESTASLSAPRGATTAVSAGLGVAFANSSRPSASTPPRVAPGRRPGRPEPPG